MAAPLAGRRVLDLGALVEQRPHALAVAMAAKLCAAYGAEVVRPLPAGGDPLALLQPRLPQGGSALERFLNTGKRSGEADGRFDVAIGDTATLARHAGAVPVQARISVFGPGEDPPMTELRLLALGGLLGIVGERDGPPARLAGHQAAYSAGLAACTGLLAALHAGGGEVVDVSLFDVTAWLNWKVAAGMLVLGKAPVRGGPTNDWYTLAASDGHIALVYQDKDWPQLRELVGDPRLREPRFNSAAERQRHHLELREVLAPWFAARSRAEITAAAQARRVPVGPVLWPAELLRDPQHAARDFLGDGGMPRLPIGWNGQRMGGTDAE
jgi:crotonobetainyl-CoA:carnitine CoA-transferase CaiB-like acyl-CoA transferase